MSGATSEQFVCSREFFCNRDELVGHATLRRYHDRYFITGLVVFFKDIDNKTDTLCIGNGSPAKFHEIFHVTSTLAVPFIYVTIRRTEL